MSGRTGKRENRSTERRLLSAGCQRPKPDRGSVQTRVTPRCLDRVILEAGLGPVAEP
jgi:hypothetical protein